MAYPAISPTSRPYATSRGATLGHSIGAYLGYSFMGDAFRKRLGAGVSIPNGAEISGYAIGGSAISRSLGLLAWNFFGLPEGSSWWDDTGAGVPGNALVAALASINTRPTDNKLQYLIGAWGYREQPVMDGGLGVTPSAAVLTYRSALANVFAALRASPGFSSDGKIGVMIPGRYISPTKSLGYELLRQEALRLLTVDANTFKACELYDYSLGDSVHPSRAGQRVIGARAADSVLQSVYATGTWTDVDPDPDVINTIRDGPSISSVSRVDSTHVAVTITGNGESIVWPSQMPGSFAFADATADLTAAYNDGSPPPVVLPFSHSVAGSVVTFTLPTPIASATVQTLFPYNDGQGFNANGIIRGASGKPLQSWYRP